MILREDEPEEIYSTRGRHSSLYPVELPSWLPSGVMNKLLQRFRTIAKEEVGKLILKHFSGSSIDTHRRTSSAQSDSAVSVDGEDVVGRQYRRPGGRYGGKLFA